MGLDLSAIPDTFWTILKRHPESQEWMFLKDDTFFCSQIDEAVKLEGDWEQKKSKARAMFGQLGEIAINPDTLKKSIFQVIEEV